MVYFKLNDNNTLDGLVVVEYTSDCAVMLRYFMAWIFQKHLDMWCDKNYRNNSRFKQHFNK